MFQRGRAAILSLIASLVLTAGLPGEEFALKPPDDPTFEGARFGSSVAGLGLGTFQGSPWPTIAIGAPEAANGSGAVFFWQLTLDPNGGLSPRELPSLSGQQGARLGAALAPIGNWEKSSQQGVSSEVAIGRPGQNSVLLYSLETMAPLNEPLPGGSDPCAGCDLGAAIAANPRGKWDAKSPRERRLLAVGAPKASGGLGRVDVFWQRLPNEGGSGALEQRRVNGEQEGERFGSAVALADVNGDGDLDVVVGSPGYKGMGHRAPRGRVRVLLAPDYLRFAPDWNLVEGESPADELGSSVAAAGDTDDDGAGDVGIGAPGASSGSGRVYAISSATGRRLYTVEGRTWKAGGEEVGEALGSSLAALAGDTGEPLDFNGDGRPDFAIGAPLASPGGRLGAGAVYVHSGPKSGGALGKLLVRYDGTSPGDNFGAAVAIGELNNDGCPDVIVGLPGVAGGGVRVLFGCPADTLQAPSDCNQDGVLDLSDGICLLGHLFLATPAKLPCGGGTLGEAANARLLDSNGDGEVDLSDGVSVFSFLFLGAPPPVLGLGCVSLEGCPTACASTP